MAIRYIAVDSGKADTKVCTELNGDITGSRRKFPTRVEEMTDCGGLNTLLGMGDAGFVVEYAGKIYGVGDIVNSDYSFTSNQSSKNDIIHKIATLTAIAISVDNDDQVYVAIGCPIEIFSSKVNREDYLNNILPAGRIDITVNGISKHFTIVSKIVLPESFGIIFINPKIFESKYIGIIDIGELNVNGAAMNKGMIASKACFTEKLGRRAIERAVKEYAEAKYETSFSMREIHFFIEQGFITDNMDPAAEEESKHYIDQVMTKHIEKISKACQNRGWDLSEMHLVFVGGTSIFLKEKIVTSFPKAFVVDDANYANVQGFLKRLCQKERA